MRIDVDFSVRRRLAIGRQNLQMVYFHEFKNFDKVKKAFKRAGLPLFSDNENLPKGCKFEVFLHGVFRGHTRKIYTGIARVMSKSVIFIVQRGVEERLLKMQREFGKCIVKSPPVLRCIDLFRCLQEVNAILRKNKLPQLKKIQTLPFLHPANIIHPDFTTINLGEDPIEEAETKIKKHEEELKKQEVKNSWLRDHHREQILYNRWKKQLLLNYIRKEWKVVLDAPYLLKYYSWKDWKNFKEKIVPFHEEINFLNLYRIWLGYHGKVRPNF